MTVDLGLALAVGLLTVVVVQLVVGQRRTASEVARLHAQVARLQRRQEDGPAGPAGAAGGAPAVVGDAVDIEGVGPDGSTRTVELERAVDPVLVLFLSTTCGTCRGLWEVAGRSGARCGAAEVAVVLREAGREDLADVAALAAANPAVPVVLSRAAWVDYEVPRTPYALLVDRFGVVVTEGPVDSWDGVELMTARLDATG